MSTDGVLPLVGGSHCIGGSIELFVVVSIK